MKPKENLPLLPLRGVLVFPHMVLHLDVGRERSIKALEKAMVSDNRILLVAQKEARVDEPETEDLFRVGTVAEIKQMIKLPGGTLRVLVEGLSRARIDRFLASEPYFEVEISVIQEDETRTAEIEAMMRSVLYQFEQYIKVSRKVPPETMATVANVEEPGRLADIIASHLNLKIDQKQEIMEAITARSRLEKLNEFLGREMEILEIERKINLRVRKQMEKTQKEYYLREQMKAIQKELGEKDERMAEAEDTGRRSPPPACRKKWKRRRSRKWSAWRRCLPPPPRRWLSAITWTGSWNCPGPSPPRIAWIWTWPKRFSTRTTTACTRSRSASWSTWRCGSWPKS